MEECLGIISEGTDTEMDMLLAAQINCQLITNQLSSPAGERGHSQSLLAALLQQVATIRQRLPPRLQSESMHYARIEVM